MRIAEGDSRLSGALYLAGAEHCALLNDAYAAFAHTNPMHTSVFPSVRRMEREVVAMTATMLGGAPGLPAGVLRARVRGFGASQLLVRSFSSCSPEEPYFVWSLLTVLCVSHVLTGCKSLAPRDFHYGAVQLAQAEPECSIVHCTCSTATTCYQRSQLCRHRPTAHAGGCQGRACLWDM